MTKVKFRMLDGPETEAEKQSFRSSIGVRAKFPRLVKSTNLVDVNVASIGSNLANSTAASVRKTEYLVAGFEGTVPVGQSVVIKLRCYDVFNVLVATIASATIAGAGYGTYEYLFSPAGGAAPALHANTSFVQVQVDYASAAGFAPSYMFLLYAFEWPGSVAFAPFNSGHGTHEAASDGINFFVISHSFNQMIVYDQELWRQSIIDIGDYPHDIVVLGNYIWIVNYDAATLQRINRFNYADISTYVAGEGHKGFGLATDGVSQLWVAYGDAILGQTPNIRSVNPATGAQTFLTNDCNGLNANIPIRYEGGYLWSIKNVDHHSDGQVKKYNTATGGTVQTISIPGLGFIYGLGSGDGKIFANANRGVAQINAASGAIEKIYYLRKTRQGEANVEVVGGLAYAPTGNGLLAIDYNTLRSEETPIVAGAKWARALPNGNVVIGPYGQPWMHEFSAA